VEVNASCFFTPGRNPVPHNSTNSNLAKLTKTLPSRFAVIGLCIHDTFGSLSCCAFAMRCSNSFDPLKFTGAFGAVESLYDFLSNESVPSLNIEGILDDGLLSVEVCGFLSASGMNRLTGGGVDLDAFGAAALAGPSSSAAP